MGENTVACGLCPHKCILQEGKTGICRTRENVKGTLINNAYANPCAVHVDPIEKKPIFHLLPGNKILFARHSGLQPAMPQLPELYH
jgi:pyruvate formate lyase activating enzyme